MLRIIIWLLFISSNRFGVTQGFSELQINLDDETFIEKSYLTSLSSSLKVNCKLHSV